MAQDHVPYGEWRETCQCTQIPEGVKSTGPGSFQCPVTGQGAQTETQELPSKYEENLLYCEGDRALEQAAQRGLEPPVQELSGHHPLQPVLGA